MGNNITLKAGTASGSLLSMMPTILSDDVARTIFLGMLGAIVSFIMTLILKKINKSYKK